MGALPKHVESIHPALWRATQLACAYGKTIDTGYAALSEQVPGGGWPVGTMTESLLQQAGVGEIRLLGPALVTVCKSGQSHSSRPSSCPMPRATHTWA